MLWPCAAPRQFSAAAVAGRPAAVNSATLRKAGRSAVGCRAGAAAFSAPPVGLANNPRPCSQVPNEVLRDWVLLRARLQQGGGLPFVVPSGQGQEFYMLRRVLLTVMQL